MRPADFRPLERLLAAALFIGCCWKVPGRAQDDKKEEPPPLKALLVTGGVSHDYPARQKILVQGIRERLSRRIEWVVRHQGGSSDERIPLFESSEWAEGYDIVVHDHCFPLVGDKAYVERVLAPHRAGVPALLIHGSMLSFRPTLGLWTGFTGTEIREHEPSRIVRLEAAAEAPPFAAKFDDRELPFEELYRVERVLPGVTTLLRSQDPSGKNHPVAWRHRIEEGGGRVFATTLGNATATLADPGFLDLVAEGFLWALDQETSGWLREVPPAVSLEGLAVPPSSPPPPRPGRNLLTGGRAAGFVWGMENDATASLANDGDPETSWKPGKAGPGSWEVRLDLQKAISRVALFWEEPLPPKATVELTSDGLGWREVAKMEPGQDGSLNLIRFSPQTASGLRVNVPSVDPGVGMALREVAAYPNESSVPAAVLMMAKAPPSEDREMTERVRGSGPSRFFELTPGWEVGGVAELPSGWGARQLVPTAEGGFFVLAFPEREGEESGKTGAVFRLDFSASAVPDLAPYLDRVPEGSLIAWDGEWLYTLFDRRLERVRKALGNGPADERQRLGEVFRFETGSEPILPEAKTLRLGTDGWLWVGVEARTTGSVFDREERACRWPTSGYLRLRLDGRRISETLLRPEEDMAKGELPVAVSDGEILLMEDEQIWLVQKGKSGGQILRIQRAGQPAAAAVNWNGLDDTEVLAVLRGERGETGRTVLQEAAQEWLRRCRREAGPVIDALEGEPSSEKLVASVTAVAGLGGEEAKERLLKLAQDRRPVLQAAAFAAFGDLPGAREHPRFSALGEVTEPGVTAALFEALVRSQTRLPGSEAVAAALVDHPDDRLAGSARAFLVHRQAVPALLGAWDERDDDEARSVISSLLSSMSDSRVAGGLLQRIDREAAPGRRASLAEVLCSWYGTRKKEGEVSRLLEEVLSAVHGMLADRRNDRAALLGSLERAGMPLPPAEKLVRYAIETPSLEAFVLATVSGEATRKERPAPWSGEIENWLAGIKDDPDKDTLSRGRALAILAGAASGDEVRSWYVASARFLGGEGLASRDEIFAAWRGRQDLASFVDWFAGQSRDADALRRSLAWQTLLAISANEENEDSIRMAAERAVASAWEESEAKREELLEAFGFLSKGERNEIVRRLRENSDDSLRACGVAVARSLGIDPEKGEEVTRVALLAREEVYAGLEANLKSGSAADGKTLARSEGCSACHHPDGEGWGFGPDLTLSFMDRSLKEFVERLPLEGGLDQRSGRRMRYELMDGRILEGWERQRGNSVIEFTDLAGNLVTVPATDLREAHDVGRGNSPCEVRMIDLSSLSDLVLYLRSLSSF